MLVTLVVVPTLLYLVLLGYVAELRGPGGTSATFVNFATTIVGAAGDKLEIEEVQTIEKETMVGLSDRTSSLGRNDPVLLTLQLGSRGYTVEDLRKYLATLSLFPRLSLVALLDPTGRFAGCTGASDLEAMMRNKTLGQAFWTAVSSGDEKEVFRYPNMAKKFIFSHETNAQP